MVCLIGLLFALDLLTPEFCVCLSCSKDVRCQLLTPHVVQNLFFLTKLLTSMDIVFPKASIESHVAVILEDGKILGPHHPCVVGGFGKLLIEDGHL